MYYRFTGYIGNLKTETLGQALDAPSGARDRDRRSRACCRRIRSAARCTRKLKVYKGSEHPHTAQQPQALDI